MQQSQQSPKKKLFDNAGVLKRTVLVSGLVHLLALKHRANAHDLGCGPHFNGIDNIFDLENFLFYHFENVTNQNKQVSLRFDKVSGSLPYFKEQDFMMKMFFTPDERGAIAGRFSLEKKDRHSYENEDENEGKNSIVVENSERVDDSF